MKTATMSFEAYARMFGLTTDADVDGHIHGGLRSAPQTKTYKRWHAKRLRELQDARDDARAKYRESVAMGLVREPERRSLGQVATDDSEAGEAARRVIARRGLRVKA